MRQRDIIHKAAMRSFILDLLLSALLALSVTGCDFLGDVVEFSLWVILIIVVLVALLIYGLIRVLF